MLIQEYFRDLADPEEFGQRGEGWFFSQLLLVVLIVFPPLFFKVLSVSDWLYMQW